MNYFLYTSKYTDLHYEESKKYITQQYQNGDLIKVSFNDENYVDYMRDSGGLEVIKDSVIYAFGEDGYYYRLYNDRTEKGEKYPPGMPKKVIKQTLRLVKEVRKNKDYQKNMARRFGSNTVNKFSGSAGFERFIYLKGNDAVLFRFKKAGIKNQPLVIYFGGAGTMGAYHGKIKADEKAFDSISSIPIWMAHASDDKVVPVKSDDQFYNALKKAGSDVIYTRWDQYGHGMCGHFYRKEKWLNWLLSKSK